jgi:predicted nucleic acid-binding protein
MGTTVLIDTDCAIDYLRGKVEGKKLIKLFLEGRAFISVLSIYELYAGMRKEEQRVTDEFIGACSILLVTEDIAKKAGLSRNNYQRKGITLSVVDCIIGETARHYGHVLATNNRKHYPDMRFWDEK